MYRHNLSSEVAHAPIQLYLCFVVGISGFVFGYFLVCVKSLTGKYFNTGCFHCAGLVKVNCIIVAL